MSHNPVDQAMSALVKSLAEANIDGIIDALKAGASAAWKEIEEEIKNPSPTPLEVLLKYVPALNVEVDCPCTRCESDRRWLKTVPWLHRTETTSLAEVIVHLNDGIGWTREQIADWLETLDLDLDIK